MANDIFTDRKNYIGASDAAAVLGMSRWKTPVQIWAEKTGVVEPDDISKKLAVKLGNRLEEVVAELFTEETGKKVHKVNEAFVHKDHDFLVCHIDRKINGENAILQCKTASAWKAKEWDGEEIPHEYIIQEIHELAVTGYERAYIAVLIGNQDFKIKIIERDEKLISEIVEKEAKFWNDFIIKNVMPSTVMAGDTDTLLKIYPKSNKNSISLDGKAGKIIESIEQLKYDVKNLESVIDQNENELKAILGENESGESGEHIITWKNQTTNRLDTTLLKSKHPEIYCNFLKGTETRVFRIKKKGEK